MVHRREGTATGTFILQPNDDATAKTPLQSKQKNYDADDTKTVIDDCESLPQPPGTDFLLNATNKSPKKSKTPSPRSTPATPTRKGRQVSQERSPRKTSITPAKRSLLLRDDFKNVTSTPSEISDVTASTTHSPAKITTSTATADFSNQQNGNQTNERFPKPPLRSGVMSRVNRLQSTSLIEPPTIARKRGRRKTICNSLEDVRSVEETVSDFGKFSSAENLTQELHPFPVEKLTCSLPLDKLSLGIMKSLLLAKSNNGTLKNHASDTDLSCHPVSPFTTNDFVGLSSPQTAARLLCLYCDKKFTSQKLLCKHTERVHATTDGRRLSSRNSVASLSWPSIIAYPGCWYCGNGGQKLTTTTTNITTSSASAPVTDDLKALFHHFLDVHSDKYYACKICELRFPNVETMEEHFTKKHSKNGGTSSKKSGTTTTPAKIASKRGAAQVVENHAPDDDLTQPLHVNVDSTERISPCDEVIETERSTTVTIFTTKTRRQLKQQAMQTRSTLVTRSCQNVLRNNEDTILTRLGVVQNRLPRGRKGTRNRRLVNAEAVVKPEQSPNTLAKARSKIGKVVTTSMKDSSDGGTLIKTTSNTRSEPLSCTFDDDFYETVSLNVRENLSCHLDGKLEGGPTSPSPLSPVPTVPAIRSTVVRSPLNVDTEIHEATALAAITAFPTLLTAEQYGSDWNTERKIKRPITRHSWKWKWDCVKKYKYVNEGGKIVKKIKQPMSGLRDLSKLDMWTQLTMRTKHELTRKESIETMIPEIGEVMRQEKRKQIAQLNSILDTRVFPQIVLEQTEQSVVKLEPENDILDVDSQNITGDPSIHRTPEEEQIPALLQLNRRSHLYYQQKESIILSGEWARPRCYICFSCGGRFDKLKTLEEHKVSRHPYIYSTHYEIVGRELIEGEFYKHLYIPVKALRGHLEYRQKLKDMKSETDTSVNTGNPEEESMDSVNSLSASTTSANGNATATTMSTMSSVEEHLIAADAASVHIPRRCTKCKRMCNGKLELYRHMLNCSGDYAWRIAQKRKYRYFGVKSRRHARQNFQRLQRRKVISKKEEDGDNSGNGTGKSPKCNPVRSRPSDADTIRRMLENLPAKRACRQIIPNITKPRCIKFSKNLGLKKLVNASCKGKGKNVNVASTTLTAISSNMRRKQRIIARQITRRSGRMAMRMRELKQNSSKIKQKEDPPKKTSTPEVVEKVVKQPIITPIAANSPQNNEKSPSDKKSVGSGKKNKKIENIVAEGASPAPPDSPSSASEKTPKKKNPAKRGQEKSPKSIADEESPSKISEKSSSPKQSPKRDSLPVNSNPTEQILSNPSEKKNPREPLNLVVPSPQTRAPFLQVSPVNKRQRGKKLTDCIAKLQEKLGGSFFDGNENLDTVLSGRRQSPPQEAQFSTTLDNLTSSTTSSAANTLLGDPANTRTPKRKTVTRKIIQKTNLEAFVAPKPALVPPAIKIESDDDGVLIGRKTSNSKSDNVSMTSDMCDSIAESDKCDVPSGTSGIVPKDNTLNELNDSAVSSMSTDSVVIPNSTPEKRNNRPNLNDIFPVNNPSDLAIRRGNRRSERVSSFLPNLNAADDYGQGTALNLSLHSFSKVDLKELSQMQPAMAFQPPTPFVNERPTRKSKSCKSPPKLNPVESMPMMEEALNLTVTKRRSSVTAAKSSPPSLQQEVFLHQSNYHYRNFAAVNFEQPKDLTNYNLTPSNLAYAEPVRNEPLNLETLPVPAKKEKKRAKSKKTLPNLVCESQTEILNVEQGCMPDLVISVESQLPVKKGRGTGKTSKKGKAITDVSEVHLTSNPVQQESIPPMETQRPFDIATLTNQSAFALPTSIASLPVPFPTMPSLPVETNILQSPDNTLNSIDNGSTAKESPDIKKPKGRPRKQTILAEMLLSRSQPAIPAIELNPTPSTVSEETGTIEEITSPKSMPKRGRKKTARGLHFKKLKDDNLHETSLDNTKAIPADPISDSAEKCDTVPEKDDASSLSEFSRVAEVPDESLKKPNEEIPNNLPTNDAEVNLTELSASVTDSPEITPTVKKKGRPKKAGKKASPKSNQSEPSDTDVALRSEILPVVGDNTGKPEAVTQSGFDTKLIEKSKNSSSLHPKVGEKFSNSDPLINQKSFSAITTTEAVPEIRPIEPLHNSTSIKDNFDNTPKPGPSGEKSIFDVLRSVQENVFFHRNEGLTRKYTRKSNAATKKPSPKLIPSIEIMASTSSEAPKEDITVANITLNVDKHLVSSNITPEETSKDLESVTCVDNQSPVENKMPETPKKAVNKRRSNRNKNLQNSPDNSSICKELDEIVASFLDDEDPKVLAPVVSNNLQGPTRFSNVDSLLNDKTVPTTSKDSKIATSADSKPENEDKPENDQEKMPVKPSVTVDKQVELTCEPKILCKELSVTLTKIPDSEIKAQLKASPLKKVVADIDTITSDVKPAEESPVILPSQPIRKGRTRRLSIKPDNISLTETNNNPEVIEPKIMPIPVINNEPKLSRKMSRKRKNPEVSNSKECDVSTDNPDSAVDQAQPHLLPTASELPPVTSNDASEEPSKSSTEKNISNLVVNPSEEETPNISTPSSLANESMKTSTPIDQDKAGAPSQKPSTTRRRRKNELAAIVADQLLESFKEVDKSRIDDLKKLENLAYEKSEDLFITGIRLTPLTKRKIVMSDHKEDSNPPKENPKPKPSKRKNKTGGNTSDLAKESDSDFATTDTERPATGDKVSTKTKPGTTSSTGKTKSKSLHENLFRNFAESQETPKLNIDPIALPKVGARNFNLTFGTFRSGAAPHEFTFGSQKEGVFNSNSNFIPGSAETSCSVESPGDRMQEDSSLKAPTETSNSKSSLHKKMKKKMNRFKKEKKAENENINELRTGLESFTFGKNTFQQFGKGVFGSVGFLGLFTSKSKDKSTQKLLSNSMPSLNNSDTEVIRFDKREEELRKPFLRPSILSMVVTQDSTSKKASRDPRLNKSKLKASNKEGPLSASQSLQELSTTDDLSDTFVKPKTGVRSSRRSASRSIETVKSISVENIDEDEDDHCLSVIAQSVNNRIMSEEEEFSQADEFEVGVPSEVSKKQKLPETTHHTPQHLLEDQRTLDMPMEDENTNTELIDMDLEDDMSVYTSFSQDASCFGSGKSRFGIRRRRRRSILLARRPKKPVPDPNQPEQSYDCTICNKTFGKATALAKHQQTFTHVQKLSEYEYLNKLNESKKKDSADETTIPSPKQALTSTPNKSDIAIESPEKPNQEPIPVEPERVSSRRRERNQHTADEAEIHDTPVADVPIQPLLPPHSQSPAGHIPSELISPPLAPPKPTSNPPILTAEIEPISSPEHAETTFERYQSSSRIALSQEERLFYECCNMLKGSETPMVERTYPVVPNTYPTYDVPNKPVTPKSSERFSYLGSEVTGNFQHGTAYTVKSPMSQSRTSPRYAYPKIDVNQFSDISSDSNPALTRTQHPHIALQPGPIGDGNPSGNKLPYYDHQTAISPTRQAFSGGEQHLQHPQSGSGAGGVHAYHHVDGGGAYYGAGDEGGPPIPLELSDSARVLTARTYITDQRAKMGYSAGTLAGYSNVVMEADRSGALMGSEQPLTSPLHSNSSQGSNTNITACRMRTKAAMKGYDNFKVSIPTMGLDIQQALERSPHGGCKLTALAEIALGSEAPITPPRYHPHSAPSTPHTPLQDEIYDKQTLHHLHHQQQEHLQHHLPQLQQQQQKSKPDINEKFAKKYQELIMNNIKPVAATKTVKKKEVCDNTNNTTPKSGYKSKSRRKGATEKTTTDFASNKLQEKNIVVEKPPKDIYEFEEESQEPIDKDIGRGSPSKGRNSIVIPERPFKNIGSEDQNTIKFHKPEEISAQNEEESQMSTTSYSDRDDFNYGSMSEGGEEDSEKEDEEEEEPKSSDSDSCASAQTAKTHKCLIMGRIFGNANKNRPIEHTEKSAPAPSTFGPKKKIPSKELNEMFDRLRKDGGRLVDDRKESAAGRNQARDANFDKKETGKGAKTARASRAAERAKRPITTTKSTPPKNTPTSEPPAKRESQRTSKSADPYFPRELAKLQAELGMTAEEVAELIGEGKRKSQRKCAINRPRTVVDTWSSDEYEDFLSTKDVIAFIEEQERRSKKKKPTNKTDLKKKNDSGAGVEHNKESSKENENDTRATQSNKKPISGKSANGTGSVGSKQDKGKVEKPTPPSAASKGKKPERVVDRLMQRFNKSRGGAKKVESKSMPPSDSEPIMPAKSAASTKPQASVQKPSTNEVDKPMSSEPIDDPSDTNLSSKKQPTLSVKPRIKSRRHTDNDSESDFENELRRRKSSSTSKRPQSSKISKRRKTIAFKEEHNDLTSDSKYTPKPKQSASIIKSDQITKSDKPAAITTTTPPSAAAKPSQGNSPATVRPLARRKRVASEMLYYWSSSSSDEEFGRIESNEVDITQKDEYLPKHGWIVGDSHKKLVTLLATAKGKKMTDLKEPATTARKKS